MKVDTGLIYTEEIASYWNLLKNLSDGIKLRLITLLSQSISTHISEDNMNKARTTKFISEFCGAWQGDVSSEDIIKVIKDSRNSLKEPISFD